MRKGYDYYRKQNISTYFKLKDVLYNLDLLQSCLIFMYAVTIRSKMESST